MTSGSPVLCQRDGPVIRITLNRPHVLNAMNRAMTDALAGMLARLSEDDTVRAIVLTGAGRAFCGGLDLKEVAAAGSVADAFDWSGPGSLFEVARACPHPIVTAVNGYAMTGGLELALLGDFLIASEAAVFADTHARVGITPSWGLTQILPRLIGPNRARQMSLTGGFVDARRALDWGLVNEVVAPEMLLPRAEELARQIAETEQTTMRRIRDLIFEGETLSLTEGLARERAVFAEHIAHVRPEAVDAARRAVTDRGRQQAPRSQTNGV